MIWVLLQSESPWQRNDAERGSHWGGGFYGYRLKFWLFYGYRLSFLSYG